MTDPGTAEKIIHVGQPNELTYNSAFEGHVYNTGLVWQALGTGIYDASKDDRFCVKSKLSLIFIRQISF